MTITFAQLKTEVSEVLRDPDNHTFEDDALGRLVNRAISEVSRIAPVPFQDDIEIVADTIEYVLREDEFDGDEVPEVDVMRVELWDTSVTPNTRYYVVPPASAGYSDDSQVGWSNWGGRLFLPNRVHTLFDGREDSLLLRVWGYSPYPALSDDSDVFGGSDEVKYAVMAFCQVEALSRLLGERELYTQWQTRSGNSDISPAGLMNALNMARDEWRRHSRAITRLRARV